MSQPGAGLLQPVYARAFEGLEVVVYYDAGEEHEARLDATKLLEAGAKSASVVAWPMDAPHGSDINGKLVDHAEGFEEWLADMIAAAKPPDRVPADDTARDGSPDAYLPPVPEPTLSFYRSEAEEALSGMLPGEHRAGPSSPTPKPTLIAILASLLAAYGQRHRTRGVSSGWGPTVIT